VERCAVRVGTRSDYGLIPHGDRGFSIDFDFIDHQLIVTTTGGDRRALPLRPGPLPISTATS